MHQINSLESLETNIYANFTCDKDGTKEQWGKKHSQMSKQKLPYRRKREKEEKAEREREGKEEKRMKSKREKRRGKKRTENLTHTSQYTHRISYSELQISM